MCTGILPGPVLGDTIVVTVGKFEDVRGREVSLNIVFAGSERVVCETLGDTYAVVGSALPDIDDGVEGKFADTDFAVDVALVVSEVAEDVTWAETDVSEVDVSADVGVDVEFADSVVA